MSKIKTKKKSEWINNIENKIKKYKEDFEILYKALKNKNLMQEFTRQAIV